MRRNIIINDPKESVLIKELEKRTDIKAERIKRLLALPDLTKKENSPVKILFDQILNLPRFKDFDLVNFYFPHSGRELQRLDFKFRFNDAFSKYIKKFNRKRLICCGDFNVAHNDIDLARPKDNRKNAGFTEAERKWMDKIVNAGMIDIYRKLYPDKQEFSWWSNMRNARARNIGWRIDYFLCFNEVFKKIRDCRIETHVFGSDHCPVILKLET